MVEIGIRDLKNRASQILRAVREGQAEYVITYRGQPVARLVPVAGPQDSERAWQELERLSQEISAHWRSDQSALELLAQVRR
jgi:prevent-host-death family protein